MLILCWSLNNLKNLIKKENCIKIKIQLNIIYKHYSYICYDDIELLLSSKYTLIKSQENKALLEFNHGYSRFEILNPIYRMII